MDGDLPPRIGEPFAREKPESTAFWLQPEQVRYRKRLSWEARPEVRDTRGIRRAALSLVSGAAAGASLLAYLAHYGNPAARQALALCLLELLLLLLLLLVIASRLSDRPRIANGILAVSALSCWVSTMPTLRLLGGLNYADPGPSISMVVLLALLLIAAFIAFSLLAGVWMIVAAEPRAPVVMCFTAGFCLWLWLVAQVPLPVAVVAIAAITGLIVLPYLPGWRRARTAAASSATGSSAPQSTGRSNRAALQLACDCLVPQFAGSIAAVAAVGVFQFVMLVLAVDPTIGVVARPVHRQVAVAISSGWNNDCALLRGGSVLCWGDDSDHQNDIPAHLTRVRQVAAGGNATCLLTSRRTVLCISQDEMGQEYVPAGLHGVVQISADAAQTCAITAQRTVECWGNDLPGVTPVPPGLYDVRQISVNGGHSCALVESGHAVCWNNNSVHANPMPAEITRATQVSAGDHDWESCALLLGGQVGCWSDDTGRRLPIPLRTGPVSQVSVGDGYTCVLAVDGTVHCWGNALADELGMTAVPHGLMGVRQISTGDAAACALLGDGSVRCWGNLYSGEIDVPSALGGSA